MATGVMLRVRDALTPHEVVPNPGGGPGYACMTCLQLTGGGPLCVNDVLKVVPLDSALDRRWELP